MAKLTKSGAKLLKQIAEMLGESKTHIPYADVTAFANSRTIKKLVGDEFLYRDGEDKSSSFLSITTTGRQELQIMNEHEQADAAAANHPEPISEQANVLRAFGEAAKAFHKIAGKAPARLYQTIIRTCKTTWGSARLWLEFDPTNDMDRQALVWLATYQEMVDDELTAAISKKAGAILEANPVFEHVEETIEYDVDIKQKDVEERPENESPIDLVDRALEGLFNDAEDFTCDLEDFGEIVKIAARSLDQARKSFDKDNTLIEATCMSLEGVALSLEEALQERRSKGAQKALSNIQEKREEELGSVDVGSWKRHEEDGKIYFQADLMPEYKIRKRAYDWAIYHGYTLLTACKEFKVAKRGAIKHAVFNDNIYKPARCSRCSCLEREENAVSTPEGVLCSKCFENGSRGPGKIAIIGCVKTKREGTFPARELYDASDLFKKRRDYVEQEYGLNYLILSAEHGLIEPLEEISSYDTTIAGRKEKGDYDILVVDVEQELLTQDCAFKTIELHAGEEYRDLLEDTKVSIRIESPFEKKLGIGKQKQWYLERTEKTDAGQVTEEQEPIAHSKTETDKNFMAAMGSFGKKTEAPVATLEKPEKTALDVREDAIEAQRKKALAALETLQKLMGDDARGDQVRLMISELDELKADSTDCPF